MFDHDYEKTFIVDIKSSISSKAFRQINYLSSLFIVTKEEFQKGKLKRLQILKKQKHFYLCITKINELTKKKKVIKD